MGTFVTSNGFIKRTLVEIKSTFVDGYRSLFGPRVDTSEEGPTGQKIGLLSKGLANAWDGLQEVYDSYDPSMATGAALDRVCNLTGVYRIQAAATVVRAILYTDADNIGSVIPSGRQARRVRGAVVFSLSADVTISPSSCQDIFLKLDTLPAAGSTVRLTTSFGTFTTVVPVYTDALAARRAVLRALVDQINATVWANAGNAQVSGVACTVELGATTYPTAAVDPSVQVQDLALRLTHVQVAFAVSDYASFKLLRVGSQGKFVCAVTGVNTVVPGELTEIVTSESGWLAVYNLVSGVTGRAVETDEQLRLRRAASFGLGLATDTAIKNAVYNRVEGVGSVSVVSNRTLETDLAGRPPKSFEVTVQGGDDQQILEAIWYAMPAGIESFGNVVGSVVDSEGSTQTVKFTRPTPLPIWVRVSYHLYSEEAFPADGELAMRAAIISFASDEYVVGKDVFGGRIMGAIYAAIPGVGNMTVEVSLDGSSWSESLSVDGRRYAYLIDARLVLVKVA